MLFSEHKQHTRLNWVVQGSCVDILLVCLDHVLTKMKDRVELRGHFHDSLYLACLCKGPHPCKQAKEIVAELEGLFNYF